MTRSVYDPMAFRIGLTQFKRHEYVEPEKNGINLPLRSSISPTLQRFFMNYQTTGYTQIVEASTYTTRISEH